jgi:hypothetical protein
VRCAPIWNSDRDQAEQYDETPEMQRLVIGRQPPASRKQPRGGSFFTIFDHQELLKQFVSFPEPAAMRQLRIAVLIPCYNESLTIGEVVPASAALPTARIYVYDNNSRDDTAMRAMLAGATVFRERRQGKGNVVRRMFADIEADIYLMADGDGTYAPEDAERPDQHADHRARRHGGRHPPRREGRCRPSGPCLRQHDLQPALPSIFGRDFTDIFSGYRAFSRRFVKSFPAVSAGFEIETEMSVHASRLKLPVCELELDYGRRPEGSHSKLSTFGMAQDPLDVCHADEGDAAFRLLRHRHRRVHGARLGFMTPVLVEYFETGLVSRMPTWVLSMVLMMISFMMFTAGVILDSVARSRAEQLRIHYMSLEAPHFQRWLRDPMSRRSTSAGTSCPRRCAA